MGIHTGLSHGVLLELNEVIRVKHLVDANSISRKVYRIVEVPPSSDTPAEDDLFSSIKPPNLRPF